MRIAVVYFGFSRTESIKKVAQGFSEGLENQGHQVDIIDGIKDSDKKLTPYGYVLIGVAGPSLFSGKLPPQILEYLKNSGNLVGKRSFGFVLKQPLFSQKVLSKLMRVMESEGMFLKLSDIVATREEAKELSKRFIVDRS